MRKEDGIIKDWKRKKALVGGGNWKERKVRENMSEEGVR